MKNVVLATLPGLLLLLVIGCFQLFRSAKPTASLPAPPLTTVPAPEPQRDQPVSPAPETLPNTKARTTKKGAQALWRTDFDAAMKEARRAHKPVFVDFYTDWCGACKYLDATTYHDPVFVQASRDWVLVKVNAEKGARNIQIAQQFRPDGYPTLLMLSSHGKVLNKVAGAYPTEMLLPEMQKAQTADGTLSAANPTAHRFG